MDSHKVYTIFCMLFDNRKEFFNRNVLQIFVEHPNGIIHRHGANHSCRHTDEFTAEVPSLAKVRKVHDSFSFHVNCILYLFFMVVVFRGNTKINVDFRAAVEAYAFWAQSRMKFVSRNRNLAGSNKFHEFFNRHFFLFSNSRHLWCDDALASSIHLSRVLHN